MMTLTYSTRAKLNHAGDASNDCNMIDPPVSDVSDQDRQYVKRPKR